MNSFLVSLKKHVILDLRVLQVSVTMCVLHIFVHRYIICMNTENKKDLSAIFFNFEKHTCNII